MKNIIYTLALAAILSSCGSSTDKDGNKLNKPIDSFNHSLDAIRYVALGKLKEHKKGAYAISIVSSNDYTTNFRSSII